MCDIETCAKYIGVTIISLAEKIEEISKTVTSDIIVIYRIKNINSIKKKLLLKNSHNIFSIKDIYGIRVLTNNEKEIYLILNKISQIFSGYVKYDYIKTPKTREGVPSLKGKELRLIIFIAYINNIPFEIQITTKKFNDENEKLHWRYHLEKYN